MNYYNEFDPKAAAWLRELIAAKLIPQGEVDERSITEVQPTDLRGFIQCHFFAGIGGWSLALQLAGWPEDRPVWTGSCPCQPFSSAGKGLAQSDERHLWPAFFNLIRECRPSTVFGEQVESAIGHGWLDGISADLESEGYACGPVVLGAHSVNSPHKRQRLYWMGRAGSCGWEELRRDRDEQPQDASGRCDIVAVADTECASGNERHKPKMQRGWEGNAEQAGVGCIVGTLGHTNSAGSQQREPSAEGDGHRSAVESTGGAAALGDSEQPGLEGLTRNGDNRNEPGRLGAHAVGSTAETGSTSSFWGDFDILHMLDGKARRIKSGTFPLVNGLPRGVVPSGDPSEQEAQATAEARVMRLKGYGNAIVPQVAAEFIKAYLEITQ